MGNIPIWVFSLSLILLFYSSVSADEDVRQSLLNFFDELSGGVRPDDPAFGWNATSDPCTGNWTGVDCTQHLAIKRVVLEGLGLAGTLDMGTICAVESISVLSIQNNSIGGEIPDEFSNCKQLTHLYFARNKLSGKLPGSFSSLNNLKKLDISNNNFSGKLPDLARISGLLMFLADKNNLSGQIPQFDFTNLQQFNLSFNNFSGPVPDLDGRFNATSLLGNPQLCGKPLKNACPPSPLSENSKLKTKNGDKIVMYVGYVLLAGVFVSFFLFKLLRRKKTDEKLPFENKKTESVKEVKTTKTSSGSSTDYKTTSRSECSIHSPNDLSVSMVSQSMVILTRSSEKGLRFEDLLKAPAELLGRGRYGSLYRVMFGSGSDLAVKRIKDWAISKEEYERRMEKIDQTKHPNVMAPVAFYCSKEEKLVVYEFQQNGSLFKLLHGSDQNARTFDWGSRLSVASTIAEALAYMHNELYEEGIAHGNLKSSNIMFKSNMDVCISEYGLMVIDDKSSSGNTPMDQSRVQPNDTFKSDVYKFGVILLELLTGKLVQNNGFDLARWVHSVVKEEWTVEVFDKALIVEGASEEQMVNLLQVALKCINPSPAARPPMNQVANMINTLREEDERSVVSEA
ncbi:probable inactive receptor kinase At2g26730 [Aristolochia californica]|uniref:probable inactive receptor kinase At2g26730 n=1 Tax=Aristolochia californica TaxID=171875 RepID=UPI0035DCFBA6